MKRSHDLMKNEKGSIEGLPLQLLIMIVIAAVGLGILLAWLNSVGDVKDIGKVYGVVDRAVIQSIQVANTDYHNLEGFWQMPNLEIRVMDKDDNPLAGCTVTISGCGVSGSIPTNVDGGAKFGSTGTMTCTLPAGTQSGHIKIEATKSGYGDANTQIPVTRGDEGTFVYKE